MKINENQIVSSKWIEQITTLYIKYNEKIAFMKQGYLWWIIDEENIFSYCITNCKIKL